MSRHNYSDDLDHWDQVRWRGAVASATRGHRGQQLFRELLVALDALAEKRLIPEDLQRDGEVCALGAVGRARGIDLAPLDPEDPEAVAQAFDIAPCLAREITFMNDDFYGETPERRWARMRAWVADQIKPKVS